MMALLRFPFRPSSRHRDVEREFRFRSIVRDQKSDAARLSSIRRAVESSIKSAESELAGLSRRLVQAMMEAAAAYEAADEDYSARDSREEKRIRETESRLLAAQHRSRRLECHIAELRELESVLGRKLRESDGSAFAD